MTDLILGLTMYWWFCGCLWWSLTDWRENNRAPEVQGFPEKPPRNPFPIWEAKPWDL